MSTRSTYDPFGWRLDELACPDLNPLHRAELLDDLLVVEAEELALGRRHLTIVHGEPSDVAEVEELNHVYDMIGDITRVAEWSRLSGGGEYLTLTAAGCGRDDALSRVVEFAHQYSQCNWQVLEAPHPGVAKP